MKLHVIVQSVKMVEVQPSRFYPRCLIPTHVRHYTYIDPYTLNRNLYPPCSDRMTVSLRAGARGNFRRCVSATASGRATTLGQPLNIDPLPQPADRSAT